jgi:hypothetical protein
MVALCFHGVDFSATSTCLHKHKNWFSTWLYAGRVEKNAIATPKQAKKNNANQNQQLKRRQSCGISTTETLT